MWKDKTPIEVDTPLPSIPKVDWTNPQSIGDDYDLLMTLKGLTDRKVAVLKREFDELHKKFDKVSRELAQAENIQSMLDSLKEI